MQDELLWAAGAAALLFAVSAFADRRRQRRSDLDRVGFMPWTLIQVLSLLATAVLAALAVVI